MELSWFPLWTGEEKLYSEKMACVICDINVPPLEPRSFSFNSAYGACKRCHGLGTVLEVDPAKLIPDANVPADKLTFMGPADRQGSAYLKSALSAVINYFKADSKVPFNELLKEVREGFLEGINGQLNFRQGAYSYQSRWKGALYWLRDRLNEAPSEKVRTALEEMVAPRTCPECKGRRLRADSLAVRFGSRGISEYTTMPIEDASTAFAGIKLNAREELIAGRFCAKSSAGWVSQHGRSQLFDPGSAFIDLIRRRGAADPSGDADWLAASGCSLRSR